MVALKTAREWGVSPAVYEKDWTPRDRALAEALTVYESGFTGLGVLRAQAEDIDTEGFWLVEPREDFAMKALHEWREANKNTAQPWAVPRVRLDPDYTPRKPPDTP